MIEEDLKKKARTRTLSTVNPYTISNQGASIFDKTEVKKWNKEFNKKTKMYNKTSKQIEVQLKIDNKSYNKRCAELLVVNLLPFDNSSSFFFNSLLVLNGKCDLSETDAHSRRLFIYRFLLENIKRILFELEENDPQKIFSEKNCEVSKRFVEYPLQQDFSDLSFLDDVLSLWNEDSVRSQSKKSYFEDSLLVYYTSNIHRYREKTFKLTQ